MNEAPAVLSTAGASSSAADVSLHRSPMSGQSRQMNQQIPRSRFITRLAHLGRLAIEVHGHRRAGRDLEPRDLHVPNAGGLEMLAALHPQHESRELVAWHRVDDAHVEQTIAYARARCHERASARR